MTRTERKCLVASTGFHALLLTLLLVGPLLVSPPHRPNDMTILKVIPWKTVDSLFSGGGNPMARPIDTPAIETAPPAPAPSQPPIPQTAPPKPEPVVAAEPQPERRTKPPSEPEVAKSGLTTEKPKPAVKVNTELVKRGSQDPQAAAKAKEREKSIREAAARAAAAAEAKARQQKLDRAFAALDGTADSLKKGFSGATAVEVPGPGGEAYANYRDVIYSIYYHAWLVPMEAADSKSSVRVRIAVRRDGTILTQEILSRSGQAAVDRSVESALDRVRAVGLPPLPETSNDAKRFFILRFTPADKLGSG